MVTAAGTNRPAVEVHQQHPLDAPIWNALSNAHVSMAERLPGVNGRPQVLRYQPDVAPFAAFSPLTTPGTGPDRETWDELAALAGPGGFVVLSGPPDLITGIPAGWTVEMNLPGIQLVATEAVSGEPDEEAVVLGERDVPEILDLVARTEPGPFKDRTVHLGRYLGIRRDGALVAMAGERMRPPGWTEISAVCTDPAFRGQGLAVRLIRAVVHGIQTRGETPFLHASDSNTSAIRLYQNLGFVPRIHPYFFGLRAPAA